LSWFFALLSLVPLSLVHGRRVETRKSRWLGLVSVGWPATLPGAPASQHSAAVWDF